MMNSILIFGAKYLYLLAVIITLVYFSYLPKTERKKFLIFAAITLPLAFIISRIASKIYFDPRPFVSNNFIPLIPHAADNGFPSYHTLIVATIAAIVFPFNKKISAIIWALAIIVGISRVYVGVHHPIDILASIAIAMFSSILSYFLLKQLKFLK